ncbi:MAG: argininosuccinate lyase [Lentisphaeria bacterium]
MAMWGGRFSENTDKAVQEYSESISYDQRLFEVDIQGSIAHAEMLGETGIITADDAAAIVTELKAIREDIAAGNFEFSTELEDIHMNIESALIERLGDVGAKLHTARSRNDQIATDERLFVRAEIDVFQEDIADLQKALVHLGRRYEEAILPGLTHLQHAQPVLLAHHLLAYMEMLERDSDRLNDCRKRVNVLPLGAGALAGSTLPIKREIVADKLGFDGVTQNSMDAVSDRDFLVELLADLSLVAMHCSRLAEDLILWSSQPCGFIDLGDAFCTGSSLMPQKKNPDVAELTRGKTGRVYGHLMGLLTTLKGLPMTYNRDLQEDKEGVFDAIDTVHAILRVLAPMLGGAEIDPERTEAAASNPDLMATDLAEWLVKQGVPFRQAHHKVGDLVGYCATKGIDIGRASLPEIQELIPEATADVLDLFSCHRSVADRDIIGATAPQQVKRQLKRWEEKLHASEA